MKKLLLSSASIRLLLVSWFSCAAFLDNFAQTRFEAESTTNWVESFNTYTNTWNVYAPGTPPAALSGGRGYGAGGSSSDCSGTRGRYILFSNLGLPEGRYNIDLQWMDLNNENLSEMWFFVGARTNISEPPVTPQASLLVSDHWLANQPNGSLHLRSYGNINLTVSDTIFMFTCAKGGSNRCVFDYIEFTPSGNPNAPTVANRTFNVNECSVIGHTVGTVLASDDDGDSFSYSITAGNGDGKFAINSVSGVITLAGSLDFETTSSYALTVRVDDHGLPSKADSATITINVTDCTNENTPVINPQAFSVNENSLNGTLVGTVVASDADVPAQTLTYSITGGNIGNVFTINNATGAITVNGALNYELRPSYTLTVRVADNGTPSRNSSGTITININDVNENLNAPTISNQTFSINENSPIGTVINTVAALDLDGHSLSYSIIAGDPDNLFYINSVTGQLLVNGVLDYETTTFHQLTVGVTDNGEPNRSATATIRVNINDIADPNTNSPVINPQAFSVDENSTPGIPVGIVAASDPDWWQTLSYSITGGTGSGLFAINSSTGQITVTGALNYESVSSYTLTVRVADNGVPSMNASATMTININDLDESGVFPFVQRQIWDGLYDIKMIAAPNHEGVFINATEAQNGRLLADSVITYSTMLMSRDKLNINNQFKGGSPFKQVSGLNLPSLLCPDPNVPCFQGLQQTTPNSSCPVRYTNQPPTISPNPWISMTYADYDDDVTTYSSSMAELDISDCSEIQAAYLYWTGMFQRSNDPITLLDGPLNTFNGVNAANVFNASPTSGHNTVKFKIPGGTYQTVMATAGNTRNDTERYLCVADVTNMVRGTGGGQFWVANIQSYPNEGNGGSTSGWVMVVVFRSPLSAPRRIMLWDGLEEIPGNGSREFDLTGLSAPSTTNFNSYVGFAALDGENINSEGISTSEAEGLGFQTQGGSYIEINPFATDQPPYKLWTSKGFPARGSGTTDNIDNCKHPLFDANWVSAYDGISSMRITSYDETTGLNGNEITRLPNNPRTLGLDAHHMKLPPGSIAAGANEATLTVKAGPQGSTIPFLAYIAIEHLQPKLEITKSVDKNFTTTDSDITYALRVKNRGNTASAAGDKVYDTLDIATDYAGGLTSTRYVNGVPSSGGVSLVSSAGGNLEFNLPAISRNDSVDIYFTVDVKSYAGNEHLWDVLCKRTITNVAYVEYNTISVGLLQTRSNANDCGIGEETRVLIIDPLLSGSSTVTLGPFDVTSFPTDRVLANVENLLVDPGGVLPGDIDEFDIRDASYNRVQPSDIFPAIGAPSYYAFRDYTGSGNCQQIYEITFDVPLPVELVSLIGQKSEGKIQVKWVTASEKNSDYYVVERSTDGIHFYPIGMVRAHGNSTTKQTYVFFDEEPSNGVNYYRLKQVAVDGTFTYTKMVVVHNQSVIALDIYPNPSNGSFTIHLLETEQPYNLDITDVNGRVVYTSEGELVPDHIEVNGLAQGVYIVRLYLGGEATVKKLIVY